MEPLRVGMPAAELAAVVAEVFEQADEYAVMLIDPALSIVSWNRGAWNLFGHAPEDVVGRSSEMIFTPEDRQQQVPQLEAAMARASGRAHDDRWHIRRDGSRFWASGVMVSLVDSTGGMAGFAKVIRDRTDLRMQIDTLKNRLTAVLEQQHRQSVAIGTLAHELRNPLAPLSNAAQLIRHAGKDDARLAYPLQIVDRQITFLQRLIDDMLDVTRIGVGKLRLQTAPFVLQDALSEAVEAVRPDAVVRGQALQALMPETPVHIDADRDRVLQIVLNLLNNAVRYTPHGGSIWLKATLESGHAVVRVEDTGQGIPADLQPRIFELFTQGTSGDGHGRGLGIGLALVKELVAAHGGTVAVRSEGLGRGSQFTVRLPLQHTPAASA